MNRLIQRSRENLKNKKGFTLIELIVVIVIIGILAAIIIPRLSGFSDTAKDKAYLATARTIYSAAAVSEAADETKNYDVANLKQFNFLETNPNTSGAAVTFTVDYPNASNAGIVVKWSGERSGQYPQ